MNLSIVVAVIYGTLTIIGGIFGYVKSRSLVSVISGSLTGLLLVLSAWIYWQGQRWGLFLAAAVTTVLIAIFAVRFRKTRQFVPAGLMTLLGTVALAIFIAQLNAY